MDDFVVHDFGDTGSLGLEAGMLGRAGGFQSVEGRGDGSGGERRGV